MAAYAETAKAKNVLGWQTTHSLDDAVASAWKWEQKIRKLKLQDYETHMLLMILFIMHGSVSTKPLFTLW